MHRDTMYRDLGTRRITYVGASQGRVNDMTPVVEVDPQGQHQFVVRLSLADDSTESWFTFSSEVLDTMGVTDDAEEDLVQRTAVYLLRHQEIADFPQIVDVEDVIATYADYLDAMRTPTGR